MSKALGYPWRVSATAIVRMAMTSGKAEEEFPVTLENPSFSQRLDKRGVPLGWLKYGSGKGPKLLVAGRVGSACTLEIRDQRGGLVEHTPIFWEPGRMFLLTAGKTRRQR